MRPRRPILEHDDRSEWEGAGPGRAGTGRARIAKTGRAACRASVARATSGSNMAAKRGEPARCRKGGPVAALRSAHPAPSGVQPAGPGLVTGQIIEPVTT